MEMLQPAPGRTVIDATFGRGGHTRAFLGRGARVIAL
ncbi:MAG: 16S rRNA (cytosine(1402)-N(4))-methyltransferase, partial [Betaproteobacteria bacterium]|nr:16S rRNA (cytosine(1402)-N(4))-methyltransferase [Betaproteobacteria bacterium]